MRDLVEATGVHRQTVHSYLRDGLLPEPCAGAGTRNARYGERHLELLRLLRELRDERGLSLDAIRRAFERAAFDPSAVRRALEGGVPPSPLLRLEDAERLTTDEVARRAGATPELVEVLIGGAVLSPEESAGARTLDDEAVPVVTAARELLALGTTEERLLRLALSARRVASIETRSLVEDATGATDGRTPLLARAEARHEAVSALLDAVRVAALHDVARRLAEVQPRTVQFALEAIYVPSPLFVKRHGLDRIVAAVEERASAEAASPGDLERLGRLLFGLGRYADAEHWLTRAVELQPRSSDIRAYHGLARALSGRIAQGLATCRLATEMDPRSTRASAFLAVALALHAATTTGLGEATEVLRAALKEARRSRTLEPRDGPEHMEVLLSRGRMFSVLPRPLTGHDEGEAELREVLSRTEGASDADNGFDLPGTNELYRVHALYYLGVSARDAGEPEEARRLLRECIVIDPGSRFAERAYELLSALDPVDRPAR